MLTFHGHEGFRDRLVLALLSNKPVRIDAIRPNDDDPGINDYEVSFLRLLERISNGTKVEISYTGTSVLFQPGTLSGGSGITHTCPLSRSIGWFLLPLLSLAPFCKSDLGITFKGVTTDTWAPSADLLRISVLPHLAAFLPASTGLELRITKRGHPPLGGGEVHFRCPAVRALKPGYSFVNTGRIQKIRGIAHSVRTSPQMANRLMAAARSVLNRYIPDIYIYTDAYKGDESGKSPGFALSLLASSTTSALYSAETTSQPPSTLEKGKEAMTPEELGVLCANQLLEQIAIGGCIDAGCENLVLLNMALSSEDVTRVRLSAPLRADTILFMRDLKAFFGTTYKIKEASPEDDDEEMEEDNRVKRNELILSCVGNGFTNVAKKTS